MTNSLTLNSLPLFPLGTVLFPGGVLPLRIFEVRYLDMIGKCQRTGAPFGVVCLTQGGEVRRPGIQDAFEGVGTLATIEHLESPQPGLLSIRCVGTQRFRVTRSEQLRHGLWTADVALIDDDKPVPVPPDLEGTADALARLVHSLEARERPVEEMPLRGPWRLDDCGWVANRWCEMLPLPVQMRQRMMELDNPLVRLELVSDLLTRSGIS
ncbi:MAG: LON peptidase substrate-binding domain-containing protein [Burkholderiaceae bacterium]|nr:LON peptidase substrate-binding domain-containing protein [Burkholderiaceae bacterium]MDO9089816.1 LON peptidase substrate-binding domain-containing protein [Burkholderiaceae bacterium]